MFKQQQKIPDKMYFRIGETADILHVKPYVLRYWETEFPDIKPVKSQSNQRLYKRKDVEMLLVIKHLLYDEKFTINGARQHLKEMMRTQGKDDEVSPVAEKEAPASVHEAHAPVVAAPVASGKDHTQILSKLRSDLGWCLNELRK